MSALYKTSAREEASTGVHICIIYTHIRERGILGMNELKRPEAFPFFFFFFFIFVVGGGCSDSSLALFV